MNQVVEVPGPTRVARTGRAVRGVAGRVVRAEVSEPMAVAAVVLLFKAAAFGLPASLILAVIDWIGFGIDLPWWASPGVPVVTVSALVVAFYVLIARAIRDNRRPTIRAGRSRP